MNNQNNILYAVTTLLLLVVLNSCNNSTVYNEYKTLPASGWNKDSVAIFNVIITDTVAHYQVLANVRNGDEYAYQNFWIFISAISPEGKITTDTIECYLTNQQGKWVGSGMGSLHEVQVLLQKDIQFKIKGNYRFAIKQGMRDDALKGISDIGLEIQKVEK